jgi:queuine tRNA-ribosyltransferase
VEPPPSPLLLLEPHDFPPWAYGPREFFKFEVLHQSHKPGSKARVGRIHTPHGVVDTPGFVAVATNAALKGVDWRDAHRANQQLVFCNTYHLMIHPGADLIEEAGGLHKFTRHAGPIITDSGGFQVFSLAHGSVHEDLTSQGGGGSNAAAENGGGGGGELKQRRQRRRKARNGDTSSAPTTSNSNNNSSGSTKMVKVTEDGVWFRSYRDGSQFLLTPESTVLAQKQLGADIIIPLDELPGYYTTRTKLQESLHRTHRWEGRSLQTHLQQVKNQAMYCVIHGGIDRQLRTESVDYLTSLPFDGHAIGGSLGNGRHELKELLEFLLPQLDSTADRRSKPRHLLGIADEESILNAVPFGIDTLDSCYPTRVARHGTILTRTGSIKIGSGKYGRQYGIPLDDQCQCSTCQHYDRSYLWHLFKAKEPLAITLATIHNLHYMNDLMKSLRDKIWNDEI